MISIWNRRSIKCAFNLIVKIRSGSVIPPVLVFPLPIYVHHTLRPDYPPFNWRDGLGYVLNVFCFRLGAIDCLNKAHCLWNPSIAYFPVSWSTSSWLTNLTSLKSLLTVRSVVLLVSSIQTWFPDLIWFVRICGQTWSLRFNYSSSCGLNELCLIFFAFTDFI